MSIRDGRVKSDLWCVWYPGPKSKHVASLICWSFCSSKLLWQYIIQEAFQLETGISSHQARGFRPVVLLCWGHPTSYNCTPNPQKHGRWMMSSSSLPARPVQLPNRCSKRHACAGWDYESRINAIKAYIYNYIDYLYEWQGSILVSIQHLTTLIHPANQTMSSSAHPSEARFQ